MKIIIAPAKKMCKEIDYLEARSVPVFLKETRVLNHYMKTCSKEELKKILRYSDALLEEAYTLYQQIDLDNAHMPALLAFIGIQYQYMAPGLFEREWFDFAQKHLRIISGFYGLLRPLDKIVPYRLEMNDPFRMGKYKSLYDFWQDKLYQELIKEDDTILDLASSQHAKLIYRYLQPNIRYIKCAFKEKCRDRYIEKGVYVKIARGLMVRYICEHQIQDLEKIKLFNEAGYHYDERLSKSDYYVFVR